MFGKTNGVASGNNGGDMVTAINNTGAALNVGDKVWLNRHVYSNTVAVKVGGGTGTSIHAYNLKDKFYYQRDNSLIKADFMNGGWNFPTVGATDSVSIRSLQIKNGMVWEYVTASKSIILKQMGGAVVVSGIVVGDGLMVSANKICTFDMASGAKLVEGGVVASNTVNAAFLFGDVLFVGQENKNFYFYDVSDISAPVLLKSGVFSCNEMVVYATGLEAGDYLISRNATSTNEWNAAVSHIYKITEGYLLENATDLPDSLSYFHGRNSRVSFNNDTGVLCVGTPTLLKFFKFSEGAFYQLDFNLPSLPETKADRPYLARVSDDLSTITIASTSGSSYTYYNVWFYRLEGFNENWYAESYCDSASAAYTGFVVSEAGVGEEVEVNTVFPKVLSLKVMVNNDDAIVDVKGVK